MDFETINIKKQRGLQTITIPENLQIDDDKVYLKKVGNVLYIIPFHNPWDNFLQSLDQFSDDFMTERNQPEEQNREAFD